MNCPACKKELKEMTVEGIAVDVCENGCAGDWLDFGELSRNREQFDTDNERSTAATPIFLKSLAWNWQI